VACGLPSFSTTRIIYTRYYTQIISPFVLGVAPRVLPIAILILVVVRLFRLRLRLGVAFGGLVLATAFCADDNHGGALVAGLHARSARSRGGRCRRCSAVSVILYDARISLSRVHLRARRKMVGYIQSPIPLARRRSK